MIGDCEGKQVSIENILRDGRLAGASSATVTTVNGIVTVQFIFNQSVAPENKPTKDSNEMAMSAGKLLAAVVAVFKPKILSEHPPRKFVFVSSTQMLSIARTALNKPALGPKPLFSLIRNHQANGLLNEFEYMRTGKSNGYVVAAEIFEKENAVNND